MSRPQDLPALLKGYGSGNYPAGSHTWSGQPQRLSPGAPLVPGATIPSPVLNYLAGYSADAAQGALNLAGQLPALNWSGAVAVGTAPVALAYSDWEQRWYAPSSTASSSSIYYSNDFGKSWTTQALAAASTAFDLAIDASGNIVVMCAGSWQVGSAGAAYSAGVTWASQGGFSSFASGSIAYDPAGVTYQWYAFGANASGNISAYTSTTRTSWIGPGLPTTWSSSTIGKSVVVGAGNGVAVAAFADSATTFRTLVRTGGGSWTSDTQHTVDPAVGNMNTNNPGIISKPVWSSVDSLFYLSVSGASGSQVWSSPDGITWTSVRAFSGSTALYLQCIGCLLVFVDGNAMVYVSWNKGANWWRCGRLSAALTTMRAGGGGLLATSGGNAYASSRFGLPTQAA